MNTLEETKPAAGSVKALQRAELQVHGMSCAAWQAFVQRTLAETCGVHDAAVNLMLHNATVLYDPALTSPGDLVARIGKAGYEATEPPWTRLQATSSNV